MKPVSYARHRFPPRVIRHAAWLYLSLRDVEELLAERGLDVSYETVRQWVAKFGTAFARNLRRLRPRPADTWHLDQMVVSIGGRRMYIGDASAANVVEPCLSDTDRTRIKRSGRSGESRAAKLLMLLRRMVAGARCQRQLLTECLA